MLKSDVIAALENARAQKRQWTDASAEFHRGYSKVVNLLLLHGAQAYLGVGDLSKVSGLTRKQVRDRMKALGLSQRQGKRMMSDRAARALAENAELLNVDPNELLTSPLAYLPMGDQMVRELEMKTAPPVTELPDIRCPRCNEPTYCGNCGTFG